MMKKIVSFVLLLAATVLAAFGILFAIIALVAHSTQLSHPEYVQKLSGLDISGSTIVSIEDTHGGFHGDGELIVIFDCTEIADSVVEQMENWKTMPMTDNLQRLMYGGDGDHTVGIGGSVGIPQIEKGYYFFWDRHSESSDPTSDSELNSRHSWNFTLLLYDADHSLLYLFEFDT